MAVLASCEPYYDDLDFDREDVPVFRAGGATPPPDPGDPAPLRVMAWNVKYGAGRIPFWFDCWGDRVELTLEEVETNLSALAALVNEVQPDVLMTEEIEVDSRRSAYVDMVQWLLEHTDLRYAAFFESWSSRYVPSEGLGRMHLGVAVFSRYPIVRATRIRQADRTDLDALTKAFYIRRVIGRAEIEVRPGARVAAYVVHTEAYDNDGTKQRQIQQIHDELAAETLPFVVGGDFNELPPTAVRVQGFLDERESAVCSEDFAQPPYTPQVMQPFYDALVPFIDLQRYGATEDAQRRYYTHSVLGPDEVNDDGVPGYWNRTLDYQFASPGTSWLAGSTDVLQVAGQRLGGEAGLGPVLVSDPLRLSDHAPVVGTWRVSP
jgi:endonuclease/exonuclease/phosphatase family metal-dependent hydrolase